MIHNMACKIFKINNFKKTHFPFYAEVAILIFLEGFMKF